MDGNEYISVAEFARMAGVTSESVYKRINKNENQLRTYLKIINGKKRINTNGLSLYGKNPVKNFSEPVKNPVENQLITLLQESMDLLKTELETKDKQIEQLNNQNDRLQDRLQEANQLNHQNQVLLIEKQQPQPIAQPPSDVKSRWWFWPFKRKGDDQE